MTLREYELLFCQLQQQERRKDIRAARLMSLMANCMAKRKGRKPFTPEDFMPRPRQMAKAPQEMDWRAMKAVTEDLTRALGGEVETREEED